MATDTLDKKHTDHSTDNGSWEGGEYPFKVGYGKLMIWYFLLSDAFTFAGFLIAYGTLRFSVPSWPVPDFVFSLFPFMDGSHPLLFVTFMTFVLLFSSFTMIRAVQEGHRENRRGIVIWMFLTILGGAAFLGCQAWEWTTLIAKENMSVTTNPFGSHTESGVYLGPDGKESTETFEAHASYLLHRIDLEANAGDAHHGGGHDVGVDDSETGNTNDPHYAGATSEAGVAHNTESGHQGGAAHESSTQTPGATEGETSAHITDTTAAHGDTAASNAGAQGTEDAHAAQDAHQESPHAEDGGGHGAHAYPGPGDYPDAVVDERGYIHRKYLVTSGENAGMIKTEAFGPKAFGALFFFITGFHGFHVFSGVVFLTIIMVNVMSGLYIARRNRNEMVEKIGLYWHFVDLVWVFVFLVFYLL